MKVVVASGNLDFNIHLIRSAPAACMAIYPNEWQKWKLKDSPGGPVEMNPPANAGAWVQSLVKEQPTCRGAPKVLSNNSWACALETALQREEPRQLENSPHLSQLQKACAQKWRSGTTKIVIISETLNSMFIISYTQPAISIQLSQWITTSRAQVGEENNIDGASFCGIVFSEQCNTSVSWILPGQFHILKLNLRVVKLLLTQL